MLIPSTLRKVSAVVTALTVVFFSAAPIMTQAADGSGTDVVSPSTAVKGSTGNTHAFTFTAAETMDSGELSLSVPAGWSAPQGSAGTAGYSTVTSASGLIATVLNPLDSSAGWHASTHISLSTDTAVFHEGTGSLAANVARSVSAGGQFYQTLGSALNWSGYTSIGFWVRSTTAEPAGGLQFRYAASGDLSSPIATLNLGAIPANTWTYQKLTLSGSRASVLSYGLRYASDVGATTINVDDMLIGPGVPSIAGGVIKARILSLASGQTVVITYGAGGGASGAAAPGTSQVSTFATQSRVSDSGALVNIAAQPTIAVSSTPTVTGVSSSLANGAYKAGQVVPVQVGFSEPVTATGTPMLALNAGSSAAYVSGSGTSTLTFNYVVGAGNASADLDYVSSSALSLNGGTIKESATGTSNADLSLAAPGAAGSLGANKDIVIDTTAPVVTGVTSYFGDGGYKAGDVIVIQVNLSENVTPHGTPQITLATGSPAETPVNFHSYYTAGGYTRIYFNYYVAPGNNSAHLDYASTSALGLNGGTLNDAAGNPADLTLPAPGAPGSLGANKDFFVDTIAPTLAVATPVATPTTDTTPDFTFNSSEAGTITYGGSCSSATTTAVAGDNTVTFDALPLGTYSDCTVTVTDLANSWGVGNVSAPLAVPSFDVIADVVSPTLAMVTPPAADSNDLAPQYTFNSSEAGHVTYGGDCAIAETNFPDVVAGDNTVDMIFETGGTFNDCTVTVTDAAGNVSEPLAIPSFTIDISPPVLTVVTPVPTPTSDTTPDFTFNAHFTFPWSAPGYIGYGGSCSSQQWEAVEGDNTVTFDELTPGTYSDCSLFVHDAGGADSDWLAIPSFTIE